METFPSGLVSKLPFFLVYHPCLLLHWQAPDWECHETSFCTPAAEHLMPATQVYVEPVPTEQDHRRELHHKSVLRKFTCASQSIWRQLFLIKSLVPRKGRAGGQRLTASNAGYTKQAARRSKLTSRTKNSQYKPQSTVDQDY